MLQTPWSLLVRHDPTLASAKAELVGDRAAAPAQKSSNLTDGLFGFRDAVNLVWLLSAGCLYIWQLGLGGLSGPDALTS